MIKVAFLFLSAAGTAAFLTCANVGGIGHEGEARISGQLVLSDGVPAAQTQVALFPDDYNPVRDTSAVPVEVTDSRGAYFFSGVLPGDYTILAINSDRKTRALIYGIRVAGTTVTVPADTLRETGKMKAFLPSIATGYAYIPGTPLYAFPEESTGFAVIDSIPIGIVPELAYSSTNDTAVTAIRYDIPIRSNDTAVVWNISWKYARRLCLNTTSNGAGLSGDVLNFPVCVKLTSANFTFSQARADGADIRFAKTDNRSLPFEIERWDTASQRAEIWVRVDTIYGNNDAQTVMMYWGKPAAADSSNGAAVFDTGRGFVGVWHLSETPLGIASIKDRTAHGYHGTPLGEFSAADLVDGLVGKGLNFRGANSTVYVGKGVKTGTSFTLEAWAFVNLIESQRFICDQNGYTLWYDQVRNGFRFEYRDKSAWRGIPQDGGAAQPMTTGVWFYLVGTCDGDRLRLYINGALTTASDSIGSAPVASTDSLLIGSAWHLEHVIGVMDEVRIESAARSDDWIKLCYMNQKEQDALVKW